MDHQVETCKELRNVIERKDHQHAIEVNEMSTQIQEMKKRENVMSEQLDVHQSNFNALKDELHEVVSFYFSYLPKPNRRRVLKPSYFSDNINVC